MTRRRRIVLGIAAAVVAGGGAFAAWVYPWYSMPAPPEEVVKEWRKVEQWADAAHGMRDPSALRAAIALLPLSDELRSLLQVDGPKFPELALETLEAGPRSAMEALERWHRSAAPGGDRCDAVCPRVELSCRTMNLLYLGRMALATSHGPEPELRVEVALHLAQTLRASGNLVGELAVAKLWQAKRLSSAAAHGDDFEAQANALEQHELQESLDRTALARVLAVPYAAQVRDFAKRVEECHAWQPAGDAP